MKKQLESSFYKRILISLLSLGVAFHLTGCAMGGSSDESSSTSGDETFAEEGEGDYAEGSDADSAEESTEAAADESTDDLSNEVAEGEGEEDMALDEEGGEAVAATDEKAEDDLSLDDEEGLPEDVAATPPAATDETKTEEPVAPPADTVATAEPPTDAPVFQEPPPAEAPIAAATSWVPVKKIKSSAFMIGDANMNRVYLARPGDTRQSVAEKVYGDKSRSKDLLKWNSYLSRGMKTGDKVYYQSATNPTDTNMLTYYEDANIPPQNYVSREGDNIREVSKTLLGDSESWKEVWATNADVESKGDIPAGINIRYWPDGAAPAAPTLAENTPPPTDPLAQPDQQQPPPDLAQQQPVVDPLAPPVDPTLNPVAAVPTATPASEPTTPIAGTTEPPPPPPPAAEPPAPPPPVPVAQQQPPPVDDMSAQSSTEEADNMMMMGLAGIVLLAAGSVFMLMRRNRARKVDLTQTTQVG